MFTMECNNNCLVFKFVNIIIYLSFLYKKNSNHYMNIHIAYSQSKIDMI